MTAENTSTTNTEIDNAADAIRRAKPKTFYVIKEGRYTSILTAAEFKALKPDVPEVGNVVDAIWAPITPKLIAKMQDALDNPTMMRSVSLGETFRKSAVEKAREVTGITFSYEDYTATLLSTGLLAIGCQRYSLNVWASTEPKMWGDGPAHYLTDEHRAAARDALIPVLRAKLKQLRDAQ